MKKSLLSTFALPLLVLLNWNLAHAATGPLDSIESQLIAENFPLGTEIGVDTGNADVNKIAGCSQVKTFQIVENNALGQVIVALCKDGEFSPRNIDAAFAKRIAYARDLLEGLPPPAAEFTPAGLGPVEVPLSNGRQGKALTLPVMGHGFALIPFAYALTPEKDMTIVVQAHLNPNAPRNLTKPIGVLLQAIDQRLAR